MANQFIQNYIKSNTTPKPNIMGSIGNAMNSIGSATKGLLNQALSTPKPDLSKNTTMQNMASLGQNYNPVNSLMNPMTGNPTQKPIMQGPTKPSSMGSTVKVPNSTVATKPYSGGVVKTPSSPGSYQGVQIQPGDQASVQAQMAQIDASKNAQNTQSNTNINNYNSNQAQGNYAPNTGNQSTNQSQDITQSGLIQKLMQLQQGLGPAAGKTAEQIANLKKDLATQLGNTYTNPIPLEFQTGRAGVLKNMEAQQESALQGQLQNQLGIANAGAGMINSAIGATAPVMQFGQITNPQTGLPVSVGSYEGNYQLQNAVSQAVQLVRNGASPNDPNVQALIAPFQLPGQSLFNQAMQQVSSGTYNPTALGTQVSTNMNLGSQYQQQSTEMDTALKQIDAITPLAVNFMNKSGLNSSDSPLYNKPINDYVAKLGNTAAGVQGAAIINDIKKYASQVLAAGAGGIPTDVSNAMAAVDPGTLNAAQLQTYLATLKYLGQNQLSVLQSQKNSAYGNAGGYGGTSTGITNTVPIGAPNKSPGSGVMSPAGQAAAGAGLGIGTDLVKTATSGGNILSFILGKLF